MKAHWFESGSAISEQTLAENQVFYETLATDAARYRAPLDKLKSARGYVQEDIVELRPTTKELDAICAKFIDEHHHDHDEVRFVLEGEGIFDIRCADDRWMRVLVEQGDLIVVPAGRHHRFLLTETKNIRCVRLFKDASGWVPHYRSASPA